MKFSSLMLAVLMSATDYAVDATSSSSASQFSIESLLRGKHHRGLVADGTTAPCSDTDTATDPFCCSIDGGETCSTTCLSTRDNLGEGAVIPSLGGITIDGMGGDWDFTTDFVAKMYNAGKVDGTQPHVANAYARYDCANSLLCLAVVSVDASRYNIDSYEDGSAWLKIYPITSTRDVTSMMDFTDREGWEGCFEVPAACHSDIQIHSNFNSGNTVSTGKTSTRTIAMDLALCSCTMPEDCTMCDSDDCLKCTCNSDNVCETAEVADCNSCTDDSCDNAAADCLIGTCNTDDGTCSFATDTTDPSCTGGGDTCTEANTSSCMLPAEYDATCAAVTCNEGACSFALTDADKPCQDAQTTDPCDLGSTCDGSGKCVQRYEAAETTCRADEATKCTKYQCKDSDEDASTDVTECMPVYNDGADCADPDSTIGPCDGGKTCMTGACTEPKYLGSETTCRVADGCCDKPEVCDGASAACPADAVRSADETCRASCDACPTDPAEMCDGIAKTCPSNLFFEDTLCIKAGQHNDVGSVNIEARKIDGGSGYEVCIELDITAPISTGGDAIKILWNTSPGGSAPGRYNIKEDATYTGECFELGGLCSDADQAPSWWFAIHIDMADGNTAWALDCTEDDEEKTESLVGTRFQGKKGFQGWGKQFNFAPCCPTDEACGGGTCSGGGDGGGGGGGGGDSTFNCDWSCGDGGASAGTCTGLTSVPAFCT